MKKYAKYEIGSDKDAARTIESMFMTTGEEDQFIKSIPKQRLEGVKMELKLLSEYVYSEVFGVQ